jgi:hypothetical protein
MKYMRKRARYTWTDYKTDTATAKDLNINSVCIKYRNKEETGCSKIPRNRLSRILKKTTDQQAEETRETFQETSRHVRSERVNKWSISMLA